jgi:SAM-dependent methyltransferase
MAVQSKGWDWSQVLAGAGGEANRWQEVSDEFLPEALRWKKAGYKAAMDLGCGLGRHSLFLASLGMRVTAFDISPSGLEATMAEAKKRHLARRITPRQGDMIGFDFGRECFDGAVAFHSMYHTDYAGLFGVVESVRQSLRPGGHFFFTLNSKNNPSFRDAANTVVDDFTVICNEGIEAGVPHTYLLPEEVPALMRGFDIDYVTESSRIFFGEDKREHRGVHIFGLAIKG